MLSWRGRQCWHLPEPNPCISILLWQCDIMMFAEHKEEGILLKYLNRTVLFWKFNIWIWNSRWFLILGTSVALSVQSLWDRFHLKSSRGEKRDSKSQLLSCARFLLKTAYSCSPEGWQLLPKQKRCSKLTSRGYSRDAAFTPLFWGGGLIVSYSITTPSPSHSHK